MSGGFFALLDDIVAMAKLAAASLDDVAAAAGKASAKAAGVVIDDTAVTPRYVHGFSPDRELPVIKRIAVGSLRNKLLIILPAALLLSQFLPWLLTPILMCGGTYLCYEGAEKLWEKFGGHGHHEPAPVVGGPDEKAMVSGAIRTDLILSAEIMVIALNEVAADDIKVLVTGNPANTNALIAMKNAPDIPTERFNALTRLDHNRAISQLAAKAGVPVTAVKQMTIWGNHSATQYPDVFNAEVNGQNAAALIDDQAWIENDFIPTVAKRGAAIIAARGSSSAASAANATIEHMRDLLNGTPAGDWVSMAVPSDGSYGVPEGIISSFPCTTSDGSYSIVQGLEIDDFSRGKIDASVAELQDEAKAVAELGLI